MTNYVVEVGLDSAVAPQPDGTYPSLASLVSGDGTRAWFTQFQNGDQLVIRFFDYGVATGSRALHLKGVVVRFLDVGTGAIVFSWVVPSVEGPPVVVAGMDELEHSAVSEVIPGALGWKIRSSGNEITFTIVDPNLAKEKAVLQVSAFALVEEGEGLHFRTYGHDPEIFVGVGG